MRQGEGVCISLKRNKTVYLCKREKAPLSMQSKEMNGGKGSLCCCCVGGFLEPGGLNMLLSHTAWHITLISSRTDASGPKQTHTAPERTTAEL